MHRSLFIMIVFAVVLMGCDGNDISGPDIPPVTDRPDDIPVACAGEEAVTARLVQAPEYGAILRPGQTIELAAEFSLLPEAYPTSVSLSLVFPNGKGGVTGVSCDIVYHSQWRETDSISCTMTVTAFTFGDPEIGAAGPIDVVFHVFNWDDQRHECDLDYRRVFERAYVYQP